MVTFEELLKYLFSNKFGKYIFYDKYSNRIEFDSINMQKQILNIYNYIETNELIPKENEWVKLIAKDNCSTFFVMFALLRAGYNVLLADSRERKEDNFIFIIDSDIYYKINSDHSIDVSKFYEDCEWAKWIGFLSSGTMGYQKEFAYNAETILRILSNVEQKIQTSKIYEILKSNSDFPNKKILSTLPMYHILGFLVPFVMYFLKCDIVFCIYSSINNIVESIRKENILGVFGVPMVWELIMNISNRKYKNSINPVRELLGNKVQIILSGGSKTKKELREFYISNGIDFFVGYGMTELGFLSLSSSDINDIDSEGSVYPMYDYRILDDGDNILPDGEGELIVDTKGLFSRILYRGELKELELFGGKFFRTGDIFILQDGELFFKGRKKNIIVSKNGENIFIEDIESKLEILKQNNILYNVAEHDDVISLYIDNHNNILDDNKIREIIEYIVDINETLYISSKIRKIIIINEYITITSKGRLAIYELNENSNIRVVKII